MYTIGLIVNTDKDKNLDITESIVKWIEQKGGHPMLTGDISSRLGKPEYCFSKENIYKESDFIIVLGGDGTILGAARESIPYEPPILGVNLGHLGFLAEAEVKEVFDSLESMLKDGVKIQERLMVESSIYSDGSLKKYYALNDIVVARGTLSRILTLDVYINDDYVTTLKGDGLIVSTPTGSTAYSLSAGGPIISPNLSVITLTPICAHSLSNRFSLVISDNEEIRIDLRENNEDTYVTVDGQEISKIAAGEHVLVRKAPYKTKLIKLLNKNFYDVLRQKLTES